MEKNKEEVVFLNTPEQPKRKQLTKQEKEHAEAVRQRLKEENIRAGIVPPPVKVETPSVGAAKDAAINLVMNPANPFLSVFREYLAGKLDLAEMQFVIDCQTCQDPKLLQAYAFQPVPVKPFNLDVAEREIKDQCKKHSPGKAREIMSAFYEEARYGDYGDYFKNRDRVLTDNSKNEAWLKEMFARLENRHPAFAARVRAMLDAYERA